MATKVKTGVLGTLTELNFADNGKARFGAGNDLQIFHAGTENFIRGNGTESPLYIDVCQNLHIRHLDTDGGNAETMIKGIGDGAVELYHNNVKKLETTSGGVTVTGGINVNSGHVNIDAGLSYQWGDSHERIEQSDGKIEFFTNNGEAMTLSSGNLGIGIVSPFSRLQSGGHTFSGSQGMHADSRVGISNHGNLTGMMLASTYNDSSHPEYGLVFVQGPTTANYNVWSISPDGPAKGNGLNFHYGSGVTNIHQPANHKIVFKGDGKVGIGTNGPGYKLDIVESVGNYAAQITNNHDSSEGLLIRCSDNDNNRYLINCQSSTSATGTNYGSKFLVTKAGRVSIGGELSPSALLHVKDTAASDAFRVDNYNRGIIFNSVGSGGMYSEYQLQGTAKFRMGQANHLVSGQSASDFAFQASSGSLLFSTGTTERMRIQSTGRTAFFQTTGGGAVTIRGEGGTSFIAISFTHNSDNGVGYIQTGASSVTYSTSSDYRLKENVVPMENGLERIQKLKPVKFNWKLDGEESEGFLAHEVQEAGWNDGITGSKDDNLVEEGQQTYQAMDYGRLTPLLVKAIQEQQAQIDELKAKLESK